MEDKEIKLVDGPLAGNLYYHCMEHPLPEEIVDSNPNAQPGTMCRYRLGAEDETGAILATFVESFQAE